MARKVLTALGIALATALSFSPATAQSRRSDALVILNSNSDAYADFQHYVKPYLDHFGVPYATQDIATTPVGSSIGNYAVIIVGHRRLDPLHDFLSPAEETNLSNAINAGTGLVNFDNDLALDGTARYQFVNTIFAFGYGASTSESGVSFPNPQAHFITARHSGGIGTGGMTMAGITLPGTVAAVATSGTQPFLAVTTHGAGRAVQWGSYDWMYGWVKGPMYGLDDLVWRSIVWAARKPFVMQGLPPFVTMRVDDESGNFEWIHIANEFGIKPWAGVFFHNIDDTEAADLSALVRAGQATASIHAFNGSFFYFNHGASDYPDATVAANFAEGTAWHLAKNIPIAKYVLPHYYEFGTNVFQGLSNWGVEFVGTQMDPGNGYGAPWVMNGPFRLYETGGSGGGSPQYYADYMTIPNHPEFAGRFFNCVTEIRDDAGYEWYPNLGDVPGTIGRGTRQTVRALDAMALPTLFTHGYYVSGSWGAGAPANWRAILSGITANIASYDPIYVTMDYACRYVRAVHDSDISAAVYDAGTNQLATSFSGSTDLVTKFFVFNGEANAISYVLVDVPQFAGSTQVTYALPGPLDHILVTPNHASVVAGANQQFTATGYDAGNNPIPNLHFTWSVVNGGGTIDANGLFTAGVTTGTFTSTVAASFGPPQGTATVTVLEPVLDHFDFAAIGSPKYKNAPFTVTITARDPAGNRVLGFVGFATLTDTTGTLTPSSIGPFSAGAWSGPVNIAALGTNVTLTVTRIGVTGVSNAFSVTTMPQGASSIWPLAPTPGNPWNNDALPLEVGVKFRAAVDGSISALRFYKDASNTGVHVGHLWDATGTLLATATFTNETGSGWQQVALTPMVEIHADTTYIASYHTGTGYAADRPYFLASGVDSPPLRALRDGEDGGNGVYKYDSTCTIPPCMPDLTYQSSNYWVDVVFLTPDSTAPTVTSTSPASGATGADPFVNVTATFSEAMDPATITTSTFTLRVDGGATDIPATVTLSGLTAILDPVGVLAYGTRYRATISTAAKDPSGNALAAAVSWTFDTVAEAQCPCTIWPDTATPATATNPDVNAIEVGVKFRSSLPGFITGLRFYKGVANAGTHVGHLWDTAGNLLGQATFTFETSSGWQEVALPSPVAIVAGTTYIASYHSTTGYAITRPGLATAVSNPPLRALADGEAGGNGVYKYDSTCTTPPCMPDLTYFQTNYWVDVVFNRADATPPTVTGTVPVSGAVSVDASSNVTVTFSEAMNPSTLTISTFRLRASGGGSDVAATVSYSGLTATLDPAGLLAPATTYQATVSGSVTDVSGNQLGTDYVWTFTTAAVAPPEVTGTSPTSGASSVDGSVNVTATFNKAMNAATVTTSTFRLRESGAGSDVPAVVSYSGLTATLDPAGPLTAGRTYQATVSGSVTDALGYPMGSDYVWTFTTAAVTTVMHTSAADFGAGPANSCSIVAHTGDGEVTLLPAIGEEFSGGPGLPSGWVSYIWNSGGTATVSGGKLMVKGARAALDPATNNYGPGRSLEFVATYATSTPYQQGGFGGGPNDVSGMYNTAPMTTFTSEAGGTGLYARAWAPAPGVNNVSASALTGLGSTRRYRIVWNTSSVEYYIDGALAYTWTVPVAGSMRPAFSVYYATAGALSVDWMRMSPFAAPCALESQVIDAGHGAHWLDLTATGSTPVGTGYSFETRSGNSATPDGTWSFFAPLSGTAIASPNGRYLQYRATLTTSDTRVTPELQQVTVRFDSCTPELCNGLDDDCDGVIDDGNPGGGGACTTTQPGVCAPGTQQCTAGAIACVRNVNPSPEACNGLDDDCNGNVDDGRGTLSIPTGVVGIPNQTVTIPALIGNVTGMGVYSAEVDVAFDATVISPTSVAPGAALNNSCTLIPNLTIANHAKVAVFCTQPLAGGGELTVVSFQVASMPYGSATTLDFASAKLNEGCPAVTAVPGSFIVRGPEICDGQDNDGVGGIDEICTVSGKVLYYRDSTVPGEPSLKPVPDVGIAVTGTVPSQTATDGTGTYLVGNLHGTVTVAPLSKLAGHNGAVSSTDAAAVAMAAVGNGSLSANQFLAGDVTDSNSISALDASYIARFSVGLVSQFPVAVTKGSDWRFLRCDTYPGGCGVPASYTINSITGPELTKNFYAILYGDVTGNWPDAGTFASARSAISSKENDAIIGDRAIADRFAREGAPPVIERRPGTGAAELSLTGWTPLRAGERRQLTVDLRNADGILGLDLVLRYDPSSLAIVNVEGTGIGSALSVARADQHGTQRIAAYGYAALSGSGSILTITVEGLRNTGRQLPPTIGGVANEGGIPLRVRERGQTPPMRR